MSFCNACLLTLDRSFSKPWLLSPCNSSASESNGSSDNPPHKTSWKKTLYLLRLFFLVVPAVPSALIYYLVSIPHTPPTNKRS